jgi:hypothetical protein
MTAINHPAASEQSNVLVGQQPLVGTGNPVSYSSVAHNGASDSKLLLSSSGTTTTGDSEGDVGKAPIVMLTDVPEDIFVVDSMDKALHAVKVHQIRANRQGVNRQLGSLAVTPLKRRN